MEGIQNYCDKVKAFLKSTDQRGIPPTSHFWLPLHATDSQLLSESLGMLVESMGPIYTRKMASSTSKPQVEELRTGHLDGYLSPF